MYHSVAPAWGDTNLREIAAHVESPLFLAHVRATSGTAIQQTNCHPFRHGRWLMVHNGVLAGFHEMRRDLMLAVDPELFNDFLYLSAFDGANGVELWRSDGTVPGTVRLSDLTGNSVVDQLSLTSTGGDL